MCIAGFFRDKKRGVLRLFSYKIVKKARETFHFSQERFRKSKYKRYSGAQVSYAKEFAFCRTRSGRGDLHDISVWIRNVTVRL